MDYTCVENVIFTYEYYPRIEVSPLRANEFLGQLGWTNFEMNRYFHGPTESSMGQMGWPMGSFIFKKMKKYKIKLFFKKLYSFSYFNIFKLS